MTGPEWRFDPLLPSKVTRGGLAASEVFPSDLKTLVRESLQNCRDQRIRNGGEGKASVTFSLRELSGAALEQFLSDIDWSELEPHIAGSADDGYHEIGPKLKRGLKRLADGLPLRILTIEDSGTLGLTGTELKKGSNLFNLARGELMTDPKRKDSGGSYGLGKTIYWTFSELSTVFFASIPDHSREPLLIGRSDLASHPADEPEWYGPGFFGEVTNDGGGEFAVALRGAAALELSSAIGAGRNPEQTGTSIMILGFDDPAVKDEPDVVATCKELVNNTIRWYWPSLLVGTLEVEVIGELDGKEVFRERPPTDVGEMPADVQPFVRAFNDMESAPDIPAAKAQPGQTIRNSVKLVVPAKNDGSSVEVEGSATLLARRMSTEEVEERDALPDTDKPEGKGQVALLRGSGMVIAYQETEGDFEGHAVLVAGRAALEPTDTDVAVDEFVRSCEPPGHNEWSGLTNRAKTGYAAGPGRRATANSSLQNLWREIKEKLTTEDQEPPVPGATGSRELSRRFPMGGRDKPDDEARGYILRIISCETTARYEIEASFQMTSTNTGPEEDQWQFIVALTVAEEGARIPAPIPVQDLTIRIAGCAMERSSANSFLVTAQRATRKIEFTIISEEDPLDGLDLREVWPTLEAKAID